MKKLYERDESKNVTCNKFGCYINGWTCHVTSNIDYALLDKEGKPIETTDILRRNEGRHK